MASRLSSALRVTVLVAAGGIAGLAQVTLTEINPVQSTLHAQDPDGASGGRVNRLARATNQILFAASEWGGLWRSTDAGRTWHRLNGHLPTVTWDVEVSPNDPNRVFATSFYDGKGNSLAGINVSADGGGSWTHPATATPPAGFCRVQARRDEPSAFGIAVDPANPQNVFIGTNCGLATSNDSGTTWRFVDPTPANGANDVWDVVVHHGGIIDTCGDDGHRRSTDGGATWTTAQAGGTPLPSGRCSLAASPDEPHVLFAAVGTLIFETDDGGGTWSTQYPNPSPQGRIPFVRTNQRAGANFDLWFGDVSLHRAACTSLVPPAPGGTPRCPTTNTFSAGFTRSAGAHDDTGDLLFNRPDPINVPECTSGCETARADCLSDCAAERDVCRADGLPPATCAKLFVVCRNACTRDFKSCVADCKLPREPCPLLMSSDGGVYLNTLTASPACQTPAWTQPDATPRGLWLFTLSGADRPNSLIQEDVYFGNQDNGTFATTNAGAASPTWTNRDCCDGFDVAAGPGQVLYTVCCFGGRANRLFLRGSGMAGGNEIPNYPDPNANVPGFRAPDVIDRFGTNRYVVLMTSGVFVTLNVTANPIVWTQLGAASSPAGACAVWASGPAQNPTFYVQAGFCNGNTADAVFRYAGAAAGGVWQQVPLPAGAPPGAGIGVFAVDRNNRNRLFASMIAAGNPQMIRSANGGQNWTNDTALDNLMQGNGVFRARTLRGPTDFTGFGGYVQPTLVALDPNDGNTLLAGGADSGLFLSRDGGATWAATTSNLGTATDPVVPRPRFAYFDRECSRARIYVGTQGRGVWRVDYPLQTVPEQKCLSECTAENKECRADCVQERESCLQDPPGSKAACAKLFAACNSACTAQLNRCRTLCRTCPE